MGDKKSRRPAAFAVGATPDSPMRGQPPEEEWWPPGAEVWPSEAEDWPDVGRPAGNGYPGNGHQGNGYPGSGYPGNGHPGNGHPGNGQRSRNGQQAGAGYAPGHGRWPGNDGWRPHPGPADPDPAPARPEDQAPRAPRSAGPESIRPRSTGYPVGSQVAGAPATAGPRSASSSAAEWSPKGARVRRNSLLRRRRRAGGGAMVRKATLDHGLRPDEVAVGDEAVPSVTEPDEPAGRPPRQWHGAGGRWMIWALRAVIWAVLIIIGFRGVTSIVSSPAPSSSAGTSSSNAAAGTDSGFPAGLAEAFALQFGNVYLNFSPATAAQRASDLTPFIPVGSAPQFGWNGAGTQLLQSEQVASISVQDAHHAVVMLLAQVNAGLIELAVPIYATQGGLVVSAEPALLPGPQRASPPQPSSAENDSTAMNALSGQLPEFFRAYASGDQQTLSRFLAPGAVVTGLGGAVTFSSISALQVPSGGSTRNITVSVVWQVVGQSTVRPHARQSVSAAPAGLDMTYEMTVVQQNGTWYVKAIGPSDQQPGGQ